MAQGADIEPKLAFCGGLARLVGSADLSDFTIACKEKKWPVHRVVLSLHSAVLGKSCGGDFNEANERTHDLSEYTCEQVQALIDYMYMFDYEVPTTANHQQAMCLHTAICILADKYDITSLSKLATDKFRHLMTSTDQACDFVDATTLAYEAERPTAEIRQALVSYLINKRILSADHEKNKPLEEVMELYPRFAIDVYRAQHEQYAENAEKANEKKTYQCPGCEHML